LFVRNGQENIFEEQKYVEKRNLLMLAGSYYLCV